MSLSIDKLLAAAPVTNRGQPTQLSTDAKGERIAYASGKSIFVRSIDNPSDCKQYTAHTAQTTVARFSPSGFYVASGDVSGAVKVWDSMGCEITKGEYHIISGRINDIAWDGDSQRIIAVGDGRERFGHCITADSGNSVGEISGHSKVINAVAMRASRPFRAVTVSDDMTVCFLHGAPFKFNSKTTEHKGFVMGAAYSPDGSSFVTVGADKKIQLYDGKTGEPTKTIGEGEHTGSIFAVSWAADSKRLVTASADRTVKTWDVESGKCTQTWKFGGDGVSVPDQQVGVVWPHGRNDGLIISLNLNGDLTYLKEGSAEPVKVILGHNKSVTALTADVSGKKLFSGSFEGKVCSWDITTGVATVVDGQTHTNKVASLSTSSSGRVHSVGWDDHLRTVDESANTFTGSTAKLAGQPRGVAALSDGTVYIATNNGIEIYDKEDGSLAGKLAIDQGEATAIAASGSYVAVGTDLNSVQLFKSSGGANLSLVTEAKNSQGQVTVLSFSKDGTHLAAGTSNGKIFVYKTPDLEVVTDRWSAHTARVTSIAWNEAGSHAASGSLDTNLHVWSLSKPGNRVKAANAHKEGISGVAWVEGDKKVASTGGDAAVKIWNVEGI